MLANVKANEDEKKTLIEANKKQEAEQAKKKVEQKKSTIDSLVASKVWAEKDREWLNSLEEDKLGQLASILKKEVAEVDDKPVSAEDYIAKAPGPIREMLSQGLNAHMNERKRLSDIILSNKSNTFTKEELADEGVFNTDRLRKLAAFAVDHTDIQQQAPAPLYYGNSGAPPAVAASDVPELAIPTLNFTKK
jgi:hypothetical protein